MSEDSGSSYQISEHIVEVRYKPNPKILDYRGTWAEVVAKHLDLSEWRIVENRFDVYDKDQYRHAFVSFKNSGIVIQDSPTKNYLPDQAIKLFRLLFDQESFGDPLYTSRIGVRSRFADQFDLEFNDLLKRFSKHFFTLNDDIKAALDAEIVDLGAPINARTPNGWINTRFGPIKEKQLRQFFKFADSPPPVAFYQDIDYWDKPEKELAGKEIISTIRRYAEENWGRYKEIMRIMNVGE